MIDGLMKITSNCILCKGRDPQKFCGRSMCPIIMKSQATAKVKEFNVSEEFSSQAPSVFIGHHGYPKVNVGILSPPEKKNDAWMYDAPKAWAKLGYGVGDVVGYRSSLINSRTKAEVGIGKSDRTEKIVEIAQEISQASRPVDVEVHLKGRPRYQTNFDPYIAPTGPNASMNNAKITSNPHINTQVEKKVSDTDLSSTQAVVQLYNKGYDENFLSKLLSMGNLGIGNNRKLVPTRWSITAVDDNVGKEILDELRDFKTCENMLFFGGYLGNYYLILFFEDVWQYELFETYMPNASWNQENEIGWTTDYEGYYGRRSYAENCAGGYYAARLPILEYLKKEKLQGSVLALRFITGEYSCPLGVWVVREATRKAMASEKKIFETKEQMIDEARKTIKERFKFDIDLMLKESILYQNIKKQTKLSQFVR